LGDELREIREGDGRDLDGPGRKLQVGSFESIEEWSLVAVELGGVLNWIQQLPRTSHTGLVA